MKFYILICQGMIITLFLALQPSFADPINKTTTLTSDIIIQNDRVYDPTKLSLVNITPYEADFTYDWNDYTTIAKNKDKVSVVETFIQSNPDLTRLNKNEKQAYGRLLYKLATYYTHVLHKADPSIQYLKASAEILKKKEQQVWISNQLAYAYEIKFSENHVDKDKLAALDYINQILNDKSPKKNDSAIAFAHSIAGLIEEASYNFGIAATHFQTAITIYKKSKHPQQDAYARAQNKLASVWLIMADKEKAAISLLKEVKGFWDKKGQSEHNPFAARNLLTLGEAYFKVNATEDAAKELQQSVQTLEEFYGEESNILIKPYQTLITINKKTGDSESIASYEKKLEILTKMRPHEPNYCEVSLS